MSTDNLARYYFNKLRYTNGNRYAGCSFESFSTVRHSHEDFYEIILIAKGSFKHMINDLTTTVSENTLLLYAPGTIHHLYTEPMLGTHFVICLSKQYFEEFIAQHFPGFQVNPETGYVAKVISKERANYIVSLGNIICHNKEFPYYLADEITFLTVSDLHNQTHTTSLDVYISEIVTKLDNQIYVDMSIEEICSKYDFSSYAILKRFKQMTGYTMVEYKKKQKLKYACKLLVITDMKIVDIFAALNYNSLPYFLRAFKEAYGMTPTEYRKKKQTNL